MCMAGAVLTLIGAGPGDPDLITLKAVKALKDADVILFDALANIDLLEHASPHAIKRFVGKRYGCHVLSQSEINSLIVEYGLIHRHIVRLKGGDPFIFGRAQEEMDAAREAGMTIVVIPGISSALAVPASQMIPLTARGIAESFWVTTGTTRSGDISNDLRLAAQSTATVVILMAMSKLEQIMEIFSGHGKSATPVAIIEKGTTANEKIVIGTVKTIAYKAQFENISNPAIIVVGEVVNLHPSQVIKKVNANISIMNKAG
jgi:uroporphyrin-III C-methyltransferase